MGSIYNRPGVGSADKARWDDTTTTVANNSAAWGTGGGGTAGLWEQLDSTTVSLCSQYVLAVAPSLSASGIIYAGCGSSDEWCSTQTTVQGNSANWETAYATTSGGVYIPADDLNVVYAPTCYQETTQSISGHFDGIGTELCYLSGQINLKVDTTTVNTLTGDLQTQITNNSNDITNIAQTSGNWNSTYTTVNTTSAAWSSAVDVTVGGNYLPADPVTVEYTPTNYSVNTTDVSGHFEGLDTQAGYLSGQINNNINDITNIAGTSGNWDSTYTSVNSNSANWNSAYGTVSGGTYGSGDGIEILYTSTNYTSTSANISGHFDGIDNQLSYLSGAIAGENLWDLNGTTIQPATLTNTVTIPVLSGSADSVVTVTSAGQLQNSTVTITQGATGGSIINIVEFTTDPNISELIAGDMWITDSPSTSGKLWKYFDGTDKYSVELSKE